MLSMVKVASSMLKEIVVKETRKMERIPHTEREG